mgnify:CR=1 FL=1
MTALQELLAKVETGTCDHGSFLQDWHGTPSYSGGCGVNAHKAYDGSLDAAKALHDAVLHERVVKREVCSLRYGGTVEMLDHGKVIGMGSNIDNNPARAWLIAILKALIATETTT